MRRITPNPYRKDSEIRQYSQVIEGQQEYKVDFSLTATARSTTVQSVAWSSEGQREVTISGEALSSGVASANVSADYSGHALVKVTATFANSTTDVQYIEIEIHDPEYAVTRA